MRKAFAVFVAVLLSTMPACLVRAEDYALSFRVDRARKTVVLESSALTAEVSGQHPSIKFHYTGDGRNLTHFRISLEKIIEYTADLEVAQECDMGGWVGIYGDPYTIMGADGSERGFNVQQAFFKHPSFPFLIVFVETLMYRSTYNETRQLGTLTTTTTTLGGVEFRTRITIIDWPFKNPDTGRLALVFRIEKEILGETSEQHRFRFEHGDGENELYIVGADTRVDEGIVKWSNSALMSNATDYYFISVETTSLEEAEHSAELTLICDCAQMGKTSVLEQTLTVGIVEENAEFIVHPTPPTITPETIIVAAAVTLVVLTIIVLKSRPKKS